MFKKHALVNNPYIGMLKYFYINIVWCNILNQMPLKDGLQKTYEWIKEQVKIKQSQVASIWVQNHLIGILLLRPIGGGLNFI